MNSNISFWTQRAQEKIDWQITSNDPHLRTLEYREIRKYLLKYSSPDSIVIDLGCGTGHVEQNITDVQYKHWYGIDPTQALINLTQPRKDTTYLCADATALVDLPKPDILFTVRALINVSNVEETYYQIIQGCKASTICLFSEATIQGLEKINSARSFHSLPLIKEASFNHYLDENLLSQYFDIIDIDHFASAYYYGSRIINPLINQEISYDADINIVFKNMKPFGEWGIHRLFVCKPRMSILDD